ncbi:MAG: cytochrome c biogenesis protein CcdA [Candidatus Ratteibacteria bacterium]|nr:cytochrome c biogenesis protein CcdA [Candidatus Ratteibacteria bacterium]
MADLFNSLSIHLKGFSLLAYLSVFAGGVVVSFTPCVYPLIPIIIGYIGGQKEKSRLQLFFLSLIYVLGMAVIYSILGAIAALSGKIFGEIQSSPLAHFIVGNIIIFLGLSLLGVFHLPVFSFGRRLKTGALGAFGIGMASGLIASPCVSPVLGTLLAFVAARQNVLYGISLLFTFALGMGVILLAAGTFTGTLAILPRSGKWMERIQKSFGIFMILLGEYFLIKAGYLL